MSVPTEAIERIEGLPGPAPQAAEVGPQPGGHRRGRLSTPGLTVAFP